MSAPLNTAIRRAGLQGLDMLRFPLRQCVKTTKKMEGCADHVQYESLRAVNDLQIMYYQDACLHDCIYFQYLLATSLLILRVDFSITGLFTIFASTIARGMQVRCIKARTLFPF